jgi:hypothetical protein
MGESFTVNNLAGGPAFLGNTRYGWVGSSYILFKKFADLIEGGSRHLGVAELISKFNYNHHYIRYSHNLVGCPETMIYTCIPARSTQDNIIDNVNYITVEPASNNNTICIMSIDNGESYYKVVYDVNSYKFNTDVRPIFVTITSKGFSPSVSILGGEFNEDLKLMGKIKIIGELKGTKNGKLIIKPRTKISMEDGNFIEIKEGLTLEGNNIALLSAVLKGDLSANNVSSKSLSHLPKEYKLIGNYPNPFNPSTSIKYALAYNSNVEIKIYDIMGKEIRTLRRFNEHAGINNMIWDGKNSEDVFVTSGIYIYKFKAISLEENYQEFVGSSKLLLVK